MAANLSNKQRNNPASTSSRNTYFYNNVQQHIYQSAFPQTEDLPQKFYETHLKRAQTRNNNIGMSRSSSQNNSASTSVPKTLSCVFQKSIRNSSNKKGNGMLTMQSQEQLVYDQIYKKPAKINIQKKQGIVIKETKELQATDYQLFSSDEELERALSPQKGDQEIDLNATLMSFHNVRSNLNHKKINRLHPETIESLADNTITMKKQNDILLPMSCFNSGGKSSLKRHQRGSSAKAKKNVSYLSDIYSLVPIHQYNELNSTSNQTLNHTQNFTQDDNSLAYEPIQQQQSNNFVLFKDFQKAVHRPHKELKGRALSAAPVSKNSEVTLARKLVFQSEDATQQAYVQVQQMRKQIQQYEILIEKKDQQIEGLEEQNHRLKSSLKKTFTQVNEMSDDLMSKQELINRMKSQIEMLLSANDQTQKQWEQERSSMITVQDQVSKVCQDQLQSFYELNKKSEQVIERLEQELKQAVQEVERANKVIHQQHDMYYNLYHKTADENNEEITQQQPYSDTYDHFSVQIPIQEFTPAKQQQPKKHQQMSIDREKLIKQNTSIFKKVHNKENHNFISLPSRNSTLQRSSKTVNYSKQRANSANYNQMSSMYSKALLALMNQ